jgi:hypothetical protein
MEISFPFLFYPGDRRTSARFGGTDALNSAKVRLLPSGIAAPGCSRQRRGRHGTVYPSFLSSFDVQPAKVEPIVRMLRFANALLEFMYYDVPAFHEALKEQGVMFVWNDSVQYGATEPQTPKQVNLTALGNPEDAILIADAKNGPHFRHYHSVSTFLGAGRVGRLRKLRLLAQTAGASVAGAVLFRSCSCWPPAIGDKSRPSERTGH